LDNLLGCVIAGMSAKEQLGTGAPALAALCDIIGCHVSELPTTQQCGHSAGLSEVAAAMMTLADLMLGILASGNEPRA